MESVFKRASRQTGEKYLQAEAELRSSRDESTPTLRANLTSDDAVDRLLAQVILNWFEKNKADYDGALRYLDGLPAYVERSPLPFPPPRGVAAYLDAEYEDRVVDLLLLRLIKEPDWPRWRVLGVLLYIKEHPEKESAGALVRYAAVVETDEYREFALDALNPLRGDDLNDSITAEESRLEGVGKTLPPEVAALKTE